MLDVTEHLGNPCVQLANETFSLLVTKSVGPRILTLQLHNSENIFAFLPNTTIETPGIGTYHIRGGHRLWHAPEVSRRTYLADDQPVKITEIAHGLLVEQPLEVETGLQKSLRITLPDESATAVVDHTLTNHGLWPVECAPWAITQMRPGGTAVLPQRTTFTDTEGLQPNRPIIIWPYTDINSPHITWGNRIIQIKATMSAGALKIGFPNPAGWLGYIWGDLFFVKQAAYDATAVYPDFGAATQCYCNNEFLELETLGPLATIQAGTAVTHRETWKLFDQIAFDGTEATAVALAKKFALPI